MSFAVYLNHDYTVVNFNGYRSIMNFRKNDESSSEKNSIKLPGNATFDLQGDGTSIQIDLPVKSHIIGLGEKAFPVDRKRRKLVSMNRDPDTYKRGEDPIYSSIPFFTLIAGNRAYGYFVDYPGKIVFDFGVDIYNKINIEVESSEFDFFVFSGRTPEEILEQYMRLTGEPVLIPKWATGHSISRYTYYPDNVALEVLDMYREFVPVDSMYFDIHHMKDYKLFTWDRDRFREPEAFINKLHERDTKIVTIIDPSVKVDQEYDVFNRLNGTYMETEKNEIYTGPMWPGISAFPDFFNMEARRKWGEEIKRWLEYGVDGIWLDMNEPTVLKDDKIIEGNALHRTDDGMVRKHREIRNAYPNFQAKATYESMAEKFSNPFILTRSGYSGIQKYAAMWSGDNISSVDDLYLQMSMVPSLSISGVTSCGCDLGGFFDNGTPDLLAAYYRMALLFPLYRNHKDKAGNEQEIFLQPPRIRENIMQSVKMRYKFQDQIYQSIYFSHKYLKPTVAPMAFYYWNDETAIHIQDQYMLGDNIIYAPNLENTQGRELYLPEGKWIHFSTGETVSGPAYLKVDDLFPIFIKNNSAVIYDHNIYVYGKGSFKIFLDGEFNISHNDHNREISTGHRKVKVEVMDS